MNVKTSLLAAPAVLAGMIFGFVFVMGTLAARSSAVATQGSIELLRLHVIVAHLHDHLLEHSYDRLQEHVDQLASGGPGTGSDGFEGGASGQVGDGDASGSRGFGRRPEAVATAGSGGAESVDVSGDGKRLLLLEQLPRTSANHESSSAADFVIVASRR